MYFPRFMKQMQWYTVHSSIYHNYFDKSMNVILFIVQIDMFYFKYSIEVNQSYCWLKKPQWKLKYAHNMAEKGTKYQTTIIYTSLKSRRNVA